jgi:hypothetical protein
MSDRTVVEIIASVIGSQDVLPLIEPIEGESVPTTYARAVVAALKAEGYGFWKRMPSEPTKPGDDW